MKKLFVLILCLIVLMPAAFSEDWDAPALLNPQEAYDYFVTETDGSDQMLFQIIDIMNEEKAIAEEYGAVKFYMTLYDDSANPAITMVHYLQICDFGYLHITEVTYDDETYYTYDIQDKMYSLIGDQVTVSDSSANDSDDPDWYWNSYVFPFGRLEVLNCMRQDANGYSYFLIKSDDYMTFEYVIGDSMKIRQLRIYTVNAQNDLQLSIVVDYDTSEAQPVPQAVLDKIEKDFGKKPSSSANNAT